MGRLVQMPPSKIERRNMIKRLAILRGLAWGLARDLRTSEIAAWLRRHAPHEKPAKKTGT